MNEVPFHYSGMMEGGKSSLAVLLLVFENASVSHLLEVNGSTAIWDVRFLKFLSIIPSIHVNKDTISSYFVYIMKVPQ